MMSITLDVLFLNKEGEIIDLCPEMRSGSLSPLVKKGYQVLELPSGTIRLKKLKKGDCLEIIWEYY